MSNLLKKLAGCANSREGAPADSFETETKSASRERSTLSEEPKPEHPVEEFITAEAVEDLRRALDDIVSGRAE